MDPLVIALGAFMLIGFASPLWVRSPTRGQRILGLYTNAAYPLFIRNASLLAPVYSAGWVIAAVAALAPPSVGPWIAILWVVVVEVAFVLSYRVPVPFLPGWMRAEIEAGRIAVARPDREDRSMLRWFLVLATAGEVAIPIIILTGGVYR